MQQQFISFFFKFCKDFAPDRKEHLQKDALIKEESSSSLILFSNSLRFFCLAEKGINRKIFSNKNVQQFLSFLQFFRVFAPDREEHQQKDTLIKEESSSSLLVFSNPLRCLRLAEKSINRKIFSFKNVQQFISFLQFFRVFAPDREEHQQKDTLKKEESSSSLLVFSNPLRCLRLAEKSINRKIFSNKNAAAVY